MTHEAASQSLTARLRRRAFTASNRLINRVVVRVRPSRFRGSPLLVLTTTGRRTGKRRRTPLLYIEDSGRFVIVASNGGANWQPAWLLNLRAEGSAMVTLGQSEPIPVVGTEITGAERARLWRQLNQTFDFESYQAKVTRTLAVVALAPVD